MKFWDFPSVPPDLLVWPPNCNTEKFPHNLRHFYDSRLLRTIAVASISLTTVRYSTVLLFPYSLLTYNIYGGLHLSNSIPYATRVTKVILYKQCIPGRPSRSEVSSYFYSIWLFNQTYSAIHASGKMAAFDLEPAPGDGAAAGRLDNVIHIHITVPYTTFI